MNITYLVRQPDDPIQTEVAGYKFMAGAETFVPDPEVIATLAGNPWFRVEGVAPIRGALSETNRDPAPQLVWPRRRGRPPKAL